MKKKLIVFALTLCMTAGLVGCKKQDVELGTYKGLKLSKVTAEVTDQEVEDEIDTILSDNADSKEIKDRAAKDGDTVTIDFDGKIDDQSFEGGSAQDYDLELGAGNFIDGFEEQLVGCKTGDKKDVTVTFPEDYGDESLDGKTAVFAVTLKAIKEIIPAVYDDAFVAKISDFKNTADYEANLKSELLASKEEDSEYTLKEDALTAVVEGTTFNSYSEDLYKQCEEEINAANEYYAELFGIPVDQLAGSEDDIKESVLSAVHEKQVITAIADKEKLSVSEDEYKAYVNENLEAFEVSSLEEFEAANDKDSVKAELLKEKVCQLIIDNAEISEVTEEEKYGSDEEYDSVIGETEPLSEDETEGTPQTESSTPAES